MTTGIRYKSLAPGLVPIFEEREAAHYARYNFLQWRTLTPLERAEGVAHYRLSTLVRLHQDDAVNAEMERRQRRSKGQGPL